MRYFVTALVFMALACASAFAVDTIACYSGSSEQGGMKLTTNGIQISEFAQRSYPTATVTVFVHGTQTLATPIYADAGASQQITNPFSSSSNSVAFWCAADGFYDVQYSGAGIATPFTVNDIHLAFSSGGGGGGGGTGCVTNPNDGGCAIPGIPSIDLFVCSSGTGTACIGGGTGWLVQWLTTRMNLTVPLNILGSGAGVVSLGCSTDPGLGSGIAMVAPATCTPYNFYWPQTAGSGFLRGSNTANKVTNLFQPFIDLTADVGTTILPVVNGGTNASTGSAALVNLYPAPTRPGDIQGVWNGSAWINCAGNSGTAAFLAESGGGACSWVQFPVPVQDGGYGLVTQTLNVIYKGNGTSAPVPSSMVDVGQFNKLRCETGLGDGLNAMAAGTYLQSMCYNASGVTWTITGIKCFTDNNGTSTLNAAGNTLGALLTGAVTCTNSFAAASQSANVLLTNGDYIKFTFAADGTSKQSTWIVTFTQ